jgi:hypothetical protein
MLYADSSNPDSNKVYQSIGFVKCGSIVDIKFGIELVSRATAISIAK